MAAMFWHRIIHNTTEKVISNSSQDKTQNENGHLLGFPSLKGITVNALPQTDERRFARNPDALTPLLTEQQIKGK